jgi:putative glutathione S-transferase
VGNVLTEADWRLFTTLIRFDAVYVGHFKCNLRTIESYPNLSGYLRELYQINGIAGTVNFEHIKAHYYSSHTMINPTGVVPMGPIVDYNTPHGRS